MKALLVLIALLLPTLLSAQERYTTSAVRLREAPSAEARILTTMPQGSKVKIDGCTHGGGEWCAVEYKTYKGYAALRLLSVAYVAPEAVPVASGTTRPSAASRGYYRGPRGGCYTYTSSGRKRYVDRSLCN
jgi:uncharacterized protein YraI